MNQSFHRNNDWTQRQSLSLQVFTTQNFRTVKLFGHITWLTCLAVWCGVCVHACVRCGCVCACMRVCVHAYVHLHCYSLGICFNICTAGKFSLQFVKGHLGFWFSFWNAGPSKWHPASSNKSSILEGHHTFNYGAATPYTSTKPYQWGGGGGGGGQTRHYN